MIEPGSIHVAVKKAVIEQKQFWIVQPEVDSPFYFEWDAPKEGHTVAFTMPLHYISGFAWEKETASDREIHNLCHWVNVAIRDVINAIKFNFWEEDHTLWITTQGIIIGSDAPPHLGLLELCTLEYPKGISYITTIAMNMAKVNWSFVIEQLVGA